MAGITYTEYLRHDAIGLAGLVRAGDVTPTELLDIALARTEAVNGDINAVVRLLPEHARAQIDAGLRQGPLSGVPFLLKDLFIDLQGTTTTSGCAFLKDTVAKQDSTVAERYKAAGLVIFGRTHSSEFGNSATTETSLFGATRNPWDLGNSAGGSSGGSAAAVAAGITPIANGSDAGGSIRTPASYCGLFGLKPTRGRVPLGPSRFDGGGGVATVHALTRSVRDSAALLDVVCGGAPGDLYAAPAQPRPFLEDVARDPARLRIAVMRRSVGGEVPAPGNADALMDAAQLCAQLGHQLEEAAPTIDVNLFMRSRGLLRAAGVLTGIRNAERALGRAARPEELESFTWACLEQGRSVSGEDIVRAREAMYVIHRQMVAFMADYDLVLSPTTALGQFPVGTLGASLPEEQTGPGLRRIGAYCSLFNFTGQPAMSVPLYWTPDGQPVGVHFAGRFGDEATLFQLAGQLERARPWLDRLPPSTLAAQH